jgi:hypothetical protein
MIPLMVKMLVVYNKRVQIGGEGDLDEEIGYIEAQLNSS